MSIQLSRILITVGVVILMLAVEGSRLPIVPSQQQSFGPLKLSIFICEGDCASGKIVFGTLDGNPVQMKQICVNQEYQVEVFLTADSIGRGRPWNPDGTWEATATGNDITSEKATGGKMEKNQGKGEKLIYRGARFTYKPTKAGKVTLNFATAGEVEHPTTHVKKKVPKKVPIRVDDCPGHVQIFHQGYYQGEGYALAWTGWMDEVELMPVDEQHYAGSGTFYMNTIYMIPGCSLSHTTYTVLTTINAVSSEETLALTFESEVGEVVLSGECGGFSFSGPQPAASLADLGLGQVTLPPEGGVVNVPDISSAGTFTIIVTWEAEEEAIPVSDAGGPTGGLPAWLILADTSQ